MTIQIKPGTYTEGITVPKVSPANGYTGGPVNAVIDLGFNEPLNITTVAPSIQVTTGGQNGCTIPVGAAIASLSGLHLDNPGSFTFQSVGGIILRR